MYFNPIRLIVFLFTLSFVSSNAWSEPVSTGQVTAELVSEFSSNRPGQSAWIGLRMELAPHWHTYWQFPGDTGLPTKVQWQLPSGWKISEPRWPWPKRFPLPPLVNFGYEGETILGYELQIPASAKPGAHSIQAKASWLVCKEECIPEQANLQLDFQVATVAEKPGALADQFRKLREQQPQELPEQAIVSQEVNDKSVLLKFQPGLIPVNSSVDFFPFSFQAVNGRNAPKWKNNILEIEKANPFEPENGKLKGILLIANGSKQKTYLIDLALAATSPSDSPVGSVVPIQVESQSAAEIAITLVLAFLGGLILNLMPCVFPVLGIKVMSLVKSTGGDSRKVRWNAKVYALGVLVSFWVLTALLLVLRAAGNSIGWGFQLQQPGFVIVLIALFSFMAANLVGLFEIGGRWMGVGASLAGREGALGSFFTGVLAVIVATPCTAPFMGTAIGVALAQPSWVVFLVFSALAFGLALPFVLLSYMPSTLRHLPKPGLWMERLKQLFAIPLVLTVVWLLWVLAQQLGLQAVAYVTLGVVLILVGAWLGNRNRFGLKRIAAWSLISLGIVLAVSSTRMRPVAISAQAVGNWQPYSETLLEKSLAEGKAVFVDFTAAWCIICQMNKKIALDRASMQEFFEQENVVLLRADWTNSDPEITKALARFGRIGVPLYLAFRKGQREPQVLPQLLTESIVRRAFE